MPDATGIIASGRTAEILFFGEGQVLKLFRPGLPEQLSSDEYNISNAVYNLGLSCPRPIEIIDYEERKGIIYSQIDGITMLKTIEKKIWTTKKQAKRMATLHRDIHSKSVSSIPKQREILIDRIQHAPLLTTEEKSIILFKLMSLKEGNKLCHGDFHPDNIMLGEKTEWVIDWMTGVEGNPAGDVARTILMLKLGNTPDETPKIISRLISLIRHKLLVTYTKEYISTSDVTMEEINQWMGPVAADQVGSR
ncbi:aminoglycoside phosphotransferase family protein [Paenibacillus segetis]|uniref:Aminoglycoside phosphotransferase n=1 Tax=Paenibacillus segetis TaxID=1325360 RepID=A0ABQ1YJW7_9BACL|nr:aminoglycoside phosphotransferase family protein [Paenibacillus segetis]GGH26885.1 aminoglycoside phosphotransferase [Paenibacillus segetis]